MGILRYSIKFTLMVGCVIVMGSCSKPKKQWPPPSRDTSEITTKSFQIHADVFYDATLSMQGFANPGIATDFARVLDRIEGSIMTGWPNSAVTFSRFGARINQLSERDQKNVVKPAFYNDPELRGITSIEKVVDAANIENLTIIVSDLFQNDADATQMVNKIKDKFIAQDMSIGLLGVKSEFDGIVFDVGILQDKFPYHGQRPFYILMIGKHRDVEHLYNSLDIRILNELHNKQFALLSRHFSYPLPTFENAQVVSKKNIDTTTSILTRGSKDSRVMQLRIKSGQPQSQLVLSLPRTRLPYTLDLNPSAVKIGLSVQKVQTIGKKDTLVPYPETTNILSTSVGISDSKIEVQLMIDGSKLTSNGLYIIEQVIYLKDNIDILPKWVSEWNMDLTKLPEWKRIPKTFEGNTTLNLKVFTLDLFQAIVQNQTPAIAHLFYYIRKE